MKEMKKFILILCCIMISVPGGYVHAEETGEEFKPAVLTSIEGKVEIKRGREEWKKPEEGLHLDPSDILRTGDKSSAEISFLDGTVVKIDENTVFELKSIMVDLDTEERGFLFRLLKGKLFSNVNPGQGGAALSKIEVETPSAVIAVRGTELFVDVQGKDTDVALFSGKASVTSEGQTVDLKSNQQTSVTKGRRPKPPFRIQEKTLKFREKFIALKKRAKDWRKATKVIRKRWQQLPPEKRMEIRKKVLKLQKAKVEEQKKKEAQRKIYRELEKGEKRRKIREDIKKRR